MFNHQLSGTGKLWFGLFARFHCVRYTTIRRFKTTSRSQPVFKKSHKLTKLPITWNKLTSYTLALSHNVYWPFPSPGSIYPSDFLWRQHSLMICHCARAWKMSQPHLDFSDISKTMFLILIFKGYFFGVAYTSCVVKFKGRRGVDSRKPEHY